MLNPITRKWQQEKDDFNRALHKDDPPAPFEPDPDHKPTSAPGGENAHDANLKNVHGPIGYTMELFKRFGADYCPAWAASLSFFSILSIGPVLLCGLAVLGYVINDPAEAAQYVQRILASVLPGNPATAQKQAAELIQDMNIQKSATTLYEKRGVAGIIGVLSLFWSALQIFLAAATPMNAAFRVKETRGFIKLRLVALGMLFGVGLLFLISLGVSSAPQLLTRLGVGGVRTFLDTFAPVGAIVLLLASVAINAVMFTVIYRFLPSPSANVTWKSARAGGILVAVLWEIAKQGYAFYLSRFANYDKVYGTFGSLIGLIFWIYYTSMILLLGAEIANLYADAQEAKRVKEKAA